MKRRNFLFFTTLTPLLLQSAKLDKPFVDERYVTISKVYDVLFTKTETMPNAQEIGIMDYLISNINHETFPNEDREFILQGAIDFKNAFPNFFTMDAEGKTKLLKETQAQNEYAQDWLSRLIYYGFEALLSDPIYGGNKQKVGWNSVRHPYGKPQPKKKYGGHV